MNGNQLTPKMGVSPLGLAAVTIDTILITFSTFATATASDLIIKYLQPARQPGESFCSPDEEDSRPP